MRKKALAALAVLGLIASLMGSAGAEQQQEPRFPRGDDYERLQARLDLMFARQEDRARAWRAGHPDLQHGFPGEHLPGSRRNMKLLNRVRLTDTEGGIADVNAHRGHAYVAKWSRTCRLNGGTGAGVSVVDVRRPGRAREVAFIRSKSNAYQTEGVHALKVKTPRFDGDLLMVSNEPCAGEFPLGGGFSLYDVTNPKRPKVLVEQFGDFDLEDITGGPNAIHSAFVWNDRKKGKAYVIASDNYEFEDVDIFDITNPRNPVQIADVTADDWPAEIWDNVAIGDLYYNHDQWVKKINGKWYGVISYWDLGNVILDLDNPANPQFVGKTMWDDVDPSGYVPEGDAHQATWNRNGRWLFTTDEDWAPYRTFFSITSGEGGGDYPADQFGWTPQIATLPGKEVKGTVVYGGLGCPTNEEYGEQAPVPNAGDFADPPEGEFKILVLLRGVCFFSEKVESAQNAGWEVVIVANNHAGSANGALPDAHLCGSQGHAFTPEIPGVCIGHRAFHLLFDQEPTYEGDDAPAIGTEGHSVHAFSEFEGWSYIRQFDFKNPAKPVQVDTYAVDESTKEEFAHIFALSPHEVKTDPRKGKRLVYSSYYQAGARVLRFSGQGMREVGHFIAGRGNDFWGVYPLARPNKRPLLLFSDRDFGLYILRYTGNE